MVYFLNTNLNTKKKVYIALTKIYGLGKYQCSQICDELGISSEKRIKQLTQTELEKLNNFITQNCVNFIKEYFQNLCHKCK